MTDTPLRSVTADSQIERDKDLAELLVLVGKHDQVAFQRLYRQTSGHLFAVLLRILKYEAAAEDALQETYMRIWRKAQTYNETLGRPLTWMTSVARYHALDVLRSTNASRQRDTSYQFESENLAVANQGTLVDQLASNQILSLCLERIDPGARQSVIDAYCEGYTHEELSNRAGIPLGTIKSWIRRALATLKECVNELS